MTEFQKNSQPPILLYMLPKFFLRQFHMSRLWEKYQYYDRRPPAVFIIFFKNFKNSKKQQKPSYFKINIPGFQRNSQTPVLFNMLPKFFWGQFHMFRIWEKCWYCDRLSPATFFFFCKNSKWHCGKRQQKSSNFHVK